MRTRSREVCRPLFGVQTFLVQVFMMSSSKQKRWKCSCVYSWKMRHRRVHCSILFCSWCEVRMVLWPLTSFTDGYESHLTLHTNRLREGNAIGSFVPTNTYIVSEGGGLNDATYASTNFGPSCMALLEFFSALLLSLCKSWHEKVKYCNINPSILMTEPWINSDTMR